MPRHAIAQQLRMLNRNNLFRNNNNDVRYPLIYMRDHLFHVAFVKLAIIYSRLFSDRGRKIIEFWILTLSFLSLVLLSYIHVAFVQTPTDCLEHMQDKWPRDGILRVEILPFNAQYNLEKSYLREKQIKEHKYIDNPVVYLSSEVVPEWEDYTMWSTFLENPNGMKNSSDSTHVMTNESSSSSAEFRERVNEIQNSSKSADAVVSEPDICLIEKLANFASLFFPGTAGRDDEWIMEFSLEYGFLKLSPSVRKQHNISVTLVTLSPGVDKCFGGAVNNFILHKFLGYDEVLLASLKLLAAREEYKGYVRDVITDVEFVFVNAWMDKKAYITAGFVMMVFTVSISILLRYSHHQIFVFIVDLLHILEFQANFNFPAGQLLTVILALVGMEAIMSEFFNDTAVAFYVILIVWAADQYDTVCCKSVFSKKHWLRFFYLYHFFFYAYSYRFGHNRFLALLTSWLFTLHSMVYFFHRYELPILTLHHQHATRNLRRRRRAGPNPEAAQASPPGNSPPLDESNAEETPDAPNPPTAEGTPDAPNPPTAEGTPDAPSPPTAEGTPNPPNAEGTPDAPNPPPDVETSSPQPADNGMEQRNTTDHEARLYLLFIFRNRDGLLLPPVIYTCQVIRPDRPAPGLNGIIVIRKIKFRAAAAGQRNKSTLRIKFEKLMYMCKRIIRSVLIKLVFLTLIFFSHFLFISIFNSVPRKIYFNDSFEMVKTFV